MRDLFIAPKDWYCLGWDSQALENRVAGHYAFPYDGGHYAHLLLEADSHEVNAKTYSSVAGKTITRSQGKSPTYGCGIIH